MTRRAEGGPTGGGCGARCAAAARTSGAATGGEGVGFWAVAAPGVEGWSVVGGVGDVVAVEGVGGGGKRRR